MLPLEKSLRRELENTIKTAREVAETAARAALEQLGVGEATPFTHLSESDKLLRRKLRAHGRQLGDERDPQKETQEITRLVEEIAYEHWHRMLFARFLAENSLLMYPDPSGPVAVTLEECEDLAADEGAKNGWELAARYAAQMLPQIFRPDSPAFALALPPEHQQRLEKLLSALHPDTFTSSDALGWTYQFWQAKRKEEVNASEVKIGARELPAVTQLFTEPYMVSFLLDNSLGAWWAGKRLSEHDLRSATSEEELREKAALDGVPLEYLRFVQDDEGKWTPASGTFDQWPERLSELKTLDPSCGSGHFLVAAMAMLVRMRMEMERLNASDAVNAVLSENIHGLDIDPRVTEIAAFALALTAWKMAGYQPLPELHIACSGLSVSAKKEEWLALAEGNAALEGALSNLYDQFKNAPVLGSLLNPSSIQSSLFDSGYESVAHLLQDALKKEKNDESTEAGIAAHGIAKAASILVSNFHFIFTNVPYLLAGKMTDELKEFTENKYEIAKNDLAFCFILRFFEQLTKGGTIACVNPNSFLHMKSYEKFRRYLLSKKSLDTLVRLGPRAFEEISGEIVRVSLNIFSNLVPTDKSYYCDFILEDEKIPSMKAEKLKTQHCDRVNQLSQLMNPEARMIIGGDVVCSLLGEVAKSYIGLQTSDNPNFTFLFWEVPMYNQKLWTLFQNPTVEIKYYSGRTGILRWDNGEGLLSEVGQIKGTAAWGKAGVAVRLMSDLPATIYNGNIFDQSSAVLIPNDVNDLTPLWLFCSSKELETATRRIDQSIKITNKTFEKIECDIEYWRSLTNISYPNGLPKPYSDDPTQWIFHGHPCGSIVWDEDVKWTVHSSLRIDDTVLQVAISRLLGYQWPAELDETMELSDEQREWAEKAKLLSSHVDDDGIVCLPAIRGEKAAHERLLSLLADAYGDEWSDDVLRTLLKNSEAAGKDLNFWLSEKFFTQHCKLFGHRPFIWHIWDGLKDGFSALVNYHKLDYKTLETLIYTYLGDWISRQKQDIGNGVDGAQERLAAAEQLKKRLEQILIGEQPYDIFVRWKPLHEQPIGWNPDLNDGVRLNIRPFLSVADVGKKGAGVLREKPNIKWEKDRGKDVESAPWYHLFNGDRINDHHLSLEEKQKARENHHA